MYEYIIVAGLIIAIIAFVAGYIHGAKKKAAQLAASENISNKVDANTEQK